MTNHGTRPTCMTSLIFRVIIQVGYVQQEKLKKMESYEYYSPPSDPGWRQQWSLVIYLKAGEQLWKYKKIVYGHPQVKSTKTYTHNTTKLSARIQVAPLFIL